MHMCIYIYMYICICACVTLRMNASVGVRVSVMFLTPGFRLRFWSPTLRPTSHTEGLSTYGQKCYRSSYADIIASIDACLLSTVLHFECFRVWFIFRARSDNGINYAYAIIIAIINSNHDNNSNSNTDSNK